jgi:hypothetical protein
MKRLGLSVLLVLLVIVGIVPFTLQAQDAMMDTHVCDSTLITLLLLAEGDYGFESMYDLSSYEKGQYAPLFEEMMMAMDDMGDDTMMDDTADMGDDTMMDDTADMGDDTMMVMLTPGHIEGEDEACTALRDELDAFFYNYWTGMSDEMTSDG